MKKLLLILIIIEVVMLSSCVNKTSTTANTETPSTITTEDNAPTTDTTTKEDDEHMNKTLVLKIDNTIVDVYWMDNVSVKELEKLAKDGLTIEMHKYSTFEQVGSLPKSIKSSDTNITTTPGDIVLYSSNQKANAGDIMLYQSNKIVLFYGSNTWDYTKLGHINLTKNELTDLLADEDVTITLSLK